MKLNLDRDPETNRAVKTIAIVSCGSKKADEETAAGFLYTSTHFQFKRRWAELYSDGWLILSAEHGLVEPIKRLEPYDTSIRDLDEDELAAWVADIEQSLWYRSNSHEGIACGNDVAWDDLPEDFTPNYEFVLLAGRAYLDPLATFFEETFPAPAYQPLTGMRIGEQNAWLKTWIEAHPSVDDVTEETAVAIDFNHQVVDDAGEPDVFFTRHESGTVMVVPESDSETHRPRILNATPEEGTLNSPPTVMANHRCWTMPADEVPAVDEAEWEAAPTLADFAGGDSER